LEVAVAEYRAQVKSMRLETDNAKREGQTARLENEMLKRKVSHRVPDCKFSCFFVVVFLS